MSSDLYNENIDLTSEDFYINTGTSDSSDDSTQANAIHQWVIDHDTSAGSPGEATQTPPSPTEAPTMHRVVRTVYTRTGVPSYDLSILHNYYVNGCKFYVVYTDGTEAECDYTDVFSPVGRASTTIVNEAAAIARATHQHFWNDLNGIHVTDISQDDWFDAIVNSFSDLSNNKQYNNILMNSLGILLRSALNNLVSLSRSGISFYDGTGNDISHILSSFGTVGAIFRESGKTKVSITSQGLTVYDNAGSISNGTETLGSEVAFIGVDVNDNPYSRIGKSAKGHVEIGVNSNNNGYIDFYNGSTILAHIGYDSGIDASGDTANAPYYTFGVRTTRSGRLDIGNYSFAEGVDNAASGWCSHSEGNSTYAFGSNSHASGYGTVASGYASYAGGSNCHAGGRNAYAIGSYTKANYENQFACGYNNKNYSDSIVEVGYGVTSQTGKNVFSIFKNGNVYIDGTTTSSGTLVTSDARVKTLISELTPKSAVDFIKQLKPKYYFKEDAEEYGFYAQEVEEIPDFGKVLVTKAKPDTYDLPDYRLLNYQGMIAPIVSALQGSLERIEQLEAENQQLKKQNEKLNERLERIEKILF